MRSGTPSAYLLNDAKVPPELDLKNTAASPYNIISVGNPSWVAPIAIQGDWCTAAQVGVPVAAAAPTAPPTGAPTPIGTSSPSGALWCGRERVRIETRIILNGVPRDAGLDAHQRPARRAGRGVFWRVQEVELP